MATRVFDLYGGRANNLIKESGKNMLIYKLLKDKADDLQYFNKISMKQGFVGIVSKTITEFKKYNISEEILNEAEEKIYNKELKEKINDLSLLYKDFNTKLHNDYIDSDDILTLLAERLLECD